MFLSIVGYVHVSVLLQLYSGNNSNTVYHVPNKIFLDIMPLRNIKLHTKVLLKFMQFTTEHVYVYFLSKITFNSA